MSSPDRRESLAQAIVIIWFAATSFYYCEHLRFFDLLRDLLAGATR